MKRNTKKVVAYMPTSSKTNMHGDSQGRQLRAIQAQPANKESSRTRSPRLGSASQACFHSGLVDRLHSGLQASAAKRGGAHAQGRKGIMEKTKPTKQQVKDLKN